MAGCELLTQCRFLFRVAVAPVSYTHLVRVPGFRNQFARPFDRFVARRECERYDQQIAPRVGVELVGGVLQRGDSVRVVAYRYDFVTPALVARHREVVGEARQAVLRLGVSLSLIHI